MYFKMSLDLQKPEIGHNEGRHAGDDRQRSEQWCPREKHYRAEWEQGMFKELREACKAITVRVTLPKSIPGETRDPCTLDSN